MTGVQTCALPILLVAGVAIAAAFINQGTDPTLLLVAGNAAATTSNCTLAASGTATTGAGTITCTLVNAPGPVLGKAERGQDAIAAIESDDPAKKDIVEATVRAIYAPVIDVHWVTVKQLAQLEPTLVETIACMIGALLKESLDEAVNTMGVPEPAARAILLGHTQVALANSLKGDNPFSDACLIAMDYGRSLSGGTG